jgi:hypothetical protein
MISAVKILFICVYLFMLYFSTLSATQATQRRKILCNKHMAVTLSTSNLPDEWLWVQRKTKTKSGVTRDLNTSMVYSIRIIL